MIIINIPPLTEERRRDLVKLAKAETENAKISIRNARKDANNNIKKSDEVSEDLLKSYEERIQDLTDKFVKQADEFLMTKEKDIMTL